MLECFISNYLFGIVVESLGSYRVLHVLAAFNLLTVLYKLDTTTEIVHICPAVIARVYHRTYISRLFIFSVVWVFWNISKFLYST